MGASDVLFVDNDLPGLDVFLHVLGVLLVHHAAHRVAGAQDFQHGSLESSRAALVPQLAGDFLHVVQRHAPVVLDVLHLLSVAGRLLQRLNNQGRYVTPESLL